MSATAIHRIIEQHAAARGDVTAIAAEGRTLSYRELNQRANALARRLIASGFHRGSRAVVRMERSPELAILLLAILKAGGAYMWVDPRESTPWPLGVSIVQEHAGGEERCIAVDLSEALAEAVSGPNLPILTRGSDIACVLPARNGMPAVLVPHTTVTTLRARPVPPVAAWSEEPGALDLWLPLMAGATVAVSSDAETAAA